VYYIINNTFVVLSIAKHSALYDLIHMARAATQILTANRLRDGDVVYWGAGKWLTGLAEAEVFLEAAQADAALAAAGGSVSDRLVVNPYLFAVRRDADAVRPVEEREIIRAAGPTIRHDLGKQASHVPV
jgi:hypothetical protein